MLLEYIKPNNVQSFDELSESTRSCIPTAVFGVSDALKYTLASMLSEKVLFIAKDPISAKKASEEFEYLTGKKSVFLPAKDDVLLFKKAFNKDSLYSRMSAIYEIANGADYVCCSFEALLQLFPKSVEALTLNVAREYSLEQILKTLVRMGYTRKEFVGEKGEFSLRGDILEIFPINSDTAFRCDFFGDEIEKIRIYDAYEQKSGEEIRTATVITAHDYFVNEKSIPTIKRRLDESLEKYGTLLVRSKAKQIVDEIKETLETNPTDSVVSFIMPLVEHSEKSVLDFLKGNFTVVYDEGRLASENLDGLIREHSERCLSLQKAGQAFDFSMKQYYDREELLGWLNSKPHIALQNLTTAVPFFKVLRTFRFNCGAIQRYALKPTDLYSDLINWKKCGYKTVICCGNKERADRMNLDLDKNGVINTETDRPSNTTGVYVTSYYLTSGFIFHDAKIVVIGTADIYVGIKEKKIKLRRKDTFSAPEVGDFAVHEKHGIGVVRGMERISTTEGTNDYVALEYAGGDVLYVPTTQLDRLTKYLGGDKAPKLSKLGGVEFERLKDKVRASISQMSINLKKLYKERAEKKGFAFSPDNELSKEFDDAFEFDETEDQLQSIAEIKHDMQSEKVMDRLLCGDVGFGKTEVALRAVFKCVMDGKQAVLVAPTTILTQQHYETCIKRFEGFGVRIALLNRFTSPQKTKAIEKEISDGSVDFVIGTHKLFGKDIKFKDLGLLVLDEEQCFGVEHKEKLRVMKTNVDTLTMSATPIPRTLHMSLSGIRDISLINTPPTNRIPVQAYVVEESDVVIRDAVTRELARNGQVFILYNRVESIYKFANHISSILPEAKFIVAHGQMPKSQLENAILSFYSGEYNVLISTTIIENGIDLPSANTLIVIDADNLGLFTLYQLKGRVGRSDKMAHAYFTYKQDKVLSENSYKRLSALMEHTELGSGYKIAMRDLEIRGAGNVLGREQHGHMDKIGYELYSKLLKEQLGEVTKDFETELDIRMDAYIPDKYIEVTSSRLDAYKLISETRTVEEAQKTLEQIENNYGKAPQEVKNLLAISVLKFMAGQARVTKAVLSKHEAYLAFADMEALNGGIQNALEQYRKTAVLSFAETPRISFKVFDRAVSTLSEMTDFLNFSLKNGN